MDSDNRKTTHDTVQIPPRKLPPVEPKPDTPPDGEFVNRSAKGRRKSLDNENDTVKTKPRKLPALKHNKKRRSTFPALDFNVDDPYDNINHWLQLDAEHHDRSLSSTPVCRPTVIVGDIPHRSRRLPDLPFDEEHKIVEGTCRQEVDELSAKLDSITAKISRQGCLKPIRPPTPPVSEEELARQEELEAERERAAEEKRRTVLERIRERRLRRSLGAVYERAMTKDGDISRKVSLDKNYRSNVDIESKSMTIDEHFMTSAVTSDHSLKL